MTVSLKYLAAEREAIKNLTAQMSLLSQPSNEALSIQRAAMGIVDRFSVFLEKVADRFKSPLGAVDDKLHVHKKPEFKLVTQLEQKLGNANYLDLVDLRVQVCPGLSVTWIELLDSWNGPVDFSVNFYDDYLHPFEKFLAVGSTNPEKFTTVGTVNRINQMDVDGFVKALTEGLSGNTKVNQRAYGQCAQRNGDALEALERSLSFGEAMSQGNLSLVKGSVDNSAKMLSDLSGLIRDSNLPFRLNAKTVNDLTDVVFQMAKMTELYAATFTYVESQKNAMEAAALKLISAIK